MISEKDIPLIPYHEVLLACAASSCKMGGWKNLAKNQIYLKWLLSKKKSDNYIPKSFMLNTNHLSEANQKEKNKYCILMHINIIYKNGTDEPICKAGIETQI